MLNCLIVVLVAVGAVPLGAKSAAAIAYGEDAPEGEYQFSVLLTMTGLPAADGGTRDSWCSGALIAPRWVITAGHCFQTGDGSRVNHTVARRTTATVGRTDLGGTGGQQAEVVAVRQATTTDVALAELGTAITGIAPLRIGTTPPAGGETLRLTGYGLTADTAMTTDGGLANDGGMTAPTTWLQTGQFTVEAVGDTLVETSGRAPRPDTSPCPHDSGGPYFRERADGTAELVAVVSSGPSCPHAGADFSARTDTLSAWITDTTADSTADTWGQRLTAGIGLLFVATCVPAVTIVLLRTTRRRRLRAASPLPGHRRARPQPAARPPASSR